jgi:hypothetical protein
MTRLLRSNKAMFRGIRTSVALVAVLALGAVGLPAFAQASSDDVIKDCAQDGKLDKHYSQRELRKAEQNLPSDIDEYTDCRSVIRAAMGGGSGSTGAAPPNGIVTASGAVAGSPEDVAALEQLTAGAAKGKHPHVSVGGKQLVPGNAGLSGVLSGLQGANGMPTSLVLAIAALVILAIVTAYLAAREKVPLVRRVALRVLGR